MSGDLGMALSRVAAPPCDGDRTAGRRCVHFDRCRNERLACRAFHRYVAGSRRTPARLPGDAPTKERYLAIFKEEEDEA